MISKQVLISIPIQEFVELIRDCVRAELGASNKESPKAAPDYIGAKEAARILSISLVTLRKYTRLSLIKGYKTGNIARYRRDEVEQALKSMHTIKHSRKED